MKWKLNLKASNSWQAKQGVPNNKNKKFQTLNIAVRFYEAEKNSVTALENATFAMENRWTQLITSKTFFAKQTEWNG